MAADMTVQPVTEGDEVTGYEYRCTFCTRVGVGYFTEGAAQQDATKHRCESRTWNETSPSDAKESS